MAYKKYIKRNGKVYGPYIYHSRRVNGKVVSEYRGQKRNFNIDYAKFGYVFLGLFILAIMLYGISISDFDFGMSGHAIMNLNAVYQEGEAIDGNLKVLVKEGELIPSNTKILFETSEFSYEYNLEDVLENSLIEGEYYVEGRDISGSGLGYGIEGIGETYPDVYFSLELISPLPESNQEDVDEPPENIPEESNEENQDTENIIDEGEAVNETNEEEDTIDETIDEETTNEIIEEDAIEESNEEPEVIEEEINEESEPEVVETEPSQEETAPLTGGVIAGFFSGLTPTGKVVLGIDNIIEGEVAYGEEFVYQLAEGQVLEIVEGSVRTSSVNLEEDKIQIEVVDGIAFVTTNYYEIEHGFGREYIGEDVETLDIDLNNLNMVFDKSDLKISLVYADEEITSLTTLLTEESNINVESEEPEGIDYPEVVEIDEGIIETITESVEGVRLEGLPEFLTSEERNLLMEEFGQDEIEITKGIAGEGKIKVRFELDDHWFESVYDVSLSKEELALQMDIDKTDWLREVIDSI